MPRTVEISVSSAKAQDTIDRLQRVDGVVSIQHQPGASLQPRGDVVTIHTTDNGLIFVSRVLDKLGIDEDGAVVTSEPRSLVAPAHAKQIDDETNEAGLEEMASMLRRETNISNNYVLAMALSGAVAAAGLWTDTVHIVIGAMVIAPGFEPLLRIPFGLLAFGQPRVPGMAIFGMGIATVDLGLAGQGLMRWAADAAAVLFAGAAILGVKRAFIHRRVSLG